MRIADILGPMSILHTCKMQHFTPSPSYIMKAIWETNNLINHILLCMHREAKCRLNRYKIDFTDISIPLLHADMLEYLCNLKTLEQIDLPSLPWVDFWSLTLCSKHCTRVQLELIFYSSWFFPLHFFWHFYCGKLQPHLRIEMKEANYNKVYCIEASLMCISIPFQCTLYISAFLFSSFIN